MPSSIIAIISWELPIFVDCDIRVTVPVRSRSTDETRLQPLGPEQQAILRRYLSTAGKSRTSDPRPASLTSVNQGSDSVVTGSGIAKTGRAGHYSLRKNLHLEGLVPSYPTARSAQVKQHQAAPLAVPEESQITPDEEEDIIGRFFVLNYFALVTITILLLVTFGDDNVPILNYSW